MDMTGTSLVALLQGVCVIMVLAYGLTRTRVFAEILDGKRSPRNLLVIAVVFGAFSIYGTLSGVPIMDARHLSNAYNFRGMCHEAKKEYPQAMADYSKAIEIFDKSSEALGNRSLLYYKLGDMDKSKADAMAAKRIDRKVKVPEFDK